VAGARVEKDETKRDPLDFALWKGAERSEWGWESPWGWGRPGWHIECSAMCKEHLGHGFDVHTGGMDLVFPHHENEIAQSEGAYDGQYARHWLHNGFVNVDAEKMSKSLGNFVTLGDVLERNDPEGFRWFLLGVHYRGPIQFDTDKLSDGRVVFPGVIEGEKRVDYLYATLGRLAALTESAATVPAKAAPEHQKLRDAARAAFASGEAALDDDLNTPVALAALGELLKLANEFADGADKRRRDAAFQGSAAILARELQLHFEALGEQLGLARAPLVDYLSRTRARRLRVRDLDEAWVEARLAERRQAREAKNFARSDELRDALASRGIAVKDTPLGVVWSVEP
jgi:cysteinyl-tRNA synthetase